MLGWLQFFSEVLGLAREIKKGPHLMDASEAAHHISKRRVEIERRRRMFDDGR